MKEIYYCIFVLSSILNVAFSQEGPDTIQLKTVQVIGKRTTEQIGLKKITLDTSILRTTTAKNLGELLSENTPIYIKSYGQGKLATSSFRGANATHTQVLWNDISINSPMLGQLDFSMISPSFIDRIDIHYGGSSITHHSGALGGSIHLKNEAEWNKKYIFISGEHGSFNTKKGAVNIAIGNKKIQSKTKLSLLSSDNNFTYLNKVLQKEAFYEQRKQADYLQRGMLQEFYLRASGHHILSGKIWLQENKRNLPPPITITGINKEEKQANNNVRSLLNWKMYSGKHYVSITGAFMKNNYQYERTINTRERSKHTETIFNGMVNYAFKTDKTELKAGVSEEYIYSTSSSYADLKTRNKQSVSASLKYLVNKRIGTLGCMRIDVLDGTLSPLTYALGMDYKVAKEEDIVLKFTIAKNHHIPTLNDLYWQPGGNPNLKEEDGYTQEITVSYGKEVKDFSFKMNATGFSSQISNWIIWQPTNFYYWEPQNLKSVSSQGVESYINATLHHRNATHKFIFNYAYTHTKNKSASSKYDKTVNKQLIYVPEHKLNLHYFLKYKKFKLTYTYNYVGRVFTDSENTRNLDDYGINDLRLSYLQKLKKITTEWTLGVDNIFNRYYEIVNDYPMPGYYLYLIFKLTV